MKRSLVLVTIFTMIIVFSMTVMAQESSELDFIHQQPYPGVAYGTEVTLHVTTSLQQPSVFFKHSDEEKWESLPLIELNVDTYSVMLPLEITRPGGFEYYFATVDVKSEIFTMDTDYSPLMEFETDDSMVIMNTRDVFYDIDYHNGKLPNDKTITVKAVAPIATNYPVSSKFAEMRSCCSNPHRGVVFSTQQTYDVDIKSAFRGRVYFTGYEANGAGNYMIVAHN